MANHPLNLAARFLLELAGLFAYGYWGWTQHHGFSRYVWAFGLPILAAVLWGALRVPDDPGHAPVAIPGWLRLLLELVYFSGATWAFFAAGRSTWSILFGILVAVHYLISYDRISWLLKQK